MSSMKPKIGLLGVLRSPETDKTQAKRDEQRKVRPL